MRQSDHVGALSLATAPGGKRGQPLRRPRRVYADSGYDHERYRDQVPQAGDQPGHRPARHRTRLRPRGAPPGGGRRVRVAALVPPPAHPLGDPRRHPPSLRQPSVAPSSAGDASNRCDLAHYSIVGRLDGAAAKSTAGVGPGAVAVRRCRDQLLWRPAQSSRSSSPSKCIVLAAPLPGSVPTAPSSCSRRMSACPACRLVSETMCTRTLNSFTLGRGHHGT